LYLPSSILNAMMEIKQAYVVLFANLG